MLRPIRLGINAEDSWTDKSGKMFDPATGVSWRAQLVRAMGGRNQLSDKIVDVIFNGRSYEVRFTDRSKLDFPMSEWLDDTMIARIALAAP